MNLISWSVRVAQYLTFGFALNASKMMRIFLFVCSDTCRLWLEERRAWPDWKKLDNAPPMLKPLCARGCHLIYRLWTTFSLRFRPWERGPFHSGLYILVWTERLSLIVLAASKRSLRVPCSLPHSLSLMEGLSNSFSVYKAQQAYQNLWSWGILRWVRFVVLADELHNSGQWSSSNLYAINGVKIRINANIRCEFTKQIILPVDKYSTVLRMGSI